MGLGIPPLRIKIMLESNPLKSRILVRGLAISHSDYLARWTQSRFGKKADRDRNLDDGSGRTPNPPTNIVDFSGSDSSIILILRDGIPRPVGDFPKKLSQAMLVGVILVGRLGVYIYIYIYIYMYVYSTLYYTLYM